MQQSAAECTASFSNFLMQRNLTALDHVAEGPSDPCELLTVKNKHENPYASSNSLLSSLYHERMTRQAPNRIAVTIRAPAPRSGHSSPSHVGSTAGSTSTSGAGGSGPALPCAAVDETGDYNASVDCDWRVELMQRPGAHLGAHVWESAYTLCDFMRAHLVDLVGFLSSTTAVAAGSAAPHPMPSSSAMSTIIELGSGCGLGGVVAARIMDAVEGSARIVLTDQAPLVPLLRDTVALQPSHSNRGQPCLQSSCMRVIDFDWGEDAHALLRRVPALYSATSSQAAEEQCSAPLLVIAADIVYHPASVPLLIRTVRRLGGASSSFASSPDSHAAEPVMQCLCLAYRRRHAPTEQPFFDALPAEWRIWTWTGDSGNAPPKEETHASARSAFLDSCAVHEPPSLNAESASCRVCRLLSPHRGFRRVRGSVNVESLPLRPVLFLIATAGSGLAQCARVAHEFKLNKMQSKTYIGESRNHRKK